MRENFAQKAQGTPPPVDTRKRLSLNERLGLISLIDEGMRLGSSGSPIVADLFNDLWELVGTTVTGSRIDRLKPEDSLKGFRAFELNSEIGENLGRLNMLYLRKPIPCYYLVYVEITAPFRRNGQGSRIIKHFGDFLIKKSAVGILDNIIPKDDPTYDIYLKQKWKPIHKIIGNAITDTDENYMVFIPPPLAEKNLKEPILRLLYHLKRKRTAIEMRDNEMMVRRTIEEFKDLYASLLTYFESEIRNGTSTSLMRFMFTRFVTKFIAFSRRIRDLIGYTGGESLEQIMLSSEIASLPMQSYAPHELTSRPTFVVGDDEIMERLPKDLKKKPSMAIESLPNYRRPSLMEWLKDKGFSPNETLTIGNLMDIGFDPTRLKEIDLDGRPFIFERVQARQLPALKKRKEILERVISEMAGAKVRNAWLKANPPLVAIRDRGNAYVIRRKVGGIHWEESLEQLESISGLKTLNKTVKLNRIILATVREAKERALEHFGSEYEDLIDQLACFVSWDLDKNQPKIIIDLSEAFFESVWLA